MSRPPVPQERVYGATITANWVGGAWVQPWIRPNQVTNFWGEAA
ncbi:hypothetical protein [Halolamina salifodinae]|uniref:Uncharacterized protein n=1 Tax=Halolamina salifodinae TaxID=1202767 RepID=A0A8T4GXD5_9EURY|nr:hypothetical protein [Halolamina salifodinae]MBP1985928.1 hypothetical protein [Halolamina salifodinae]